MSRFEGRVLFPPFKIVGPQYELIILDGGSKAERHQPLFVRVRQPAKQNSVNDAEHGRCRAHPAGNRGNRRQREHRLANKASHRISNVLHQRLPASLTPAEAESLEAQVKANPDDLQTRTKLLFYYGSHGATRATSDESDAIRRHVLWLIENHPEAHVLAMPAAFLDLFAKAQAERLWSKIAEQPGNSEAVLANAIYFYTKADRALAFRLVADARKAFPSNAVFARTEGMLVAFEILGVKSTDRYDMAIDFDARMAASPRALQLRAQLERTTDYSLLGGAANTFLAQQSALLMKGKREDAQAAIETARSYFERAMKAEPANREWRAGMRRVYQRLAGNERDAAAKLPYLEKAAAIGVTREEHFTILADLAQAHWDTGQAEQAETEARQLLDLASGFKSNWNYGNAIHNGNSILGQVALQKGDVQKAKNCLLEAGRTPGSPQLNSFGPKMVLAQALLERGERDTVSEYLTLCKAFWKLDQGRLDSWSNTIRNGGTPNLAGAPSLKARPNMIGRSAPSFRLRGLDGQEHALQEFAER